MGAGGAEFGAALGRGGGWGLRSPAGGPQRRAVLGAGAALAVTPLAEHVGFALMTAFRSWLCGLSASGALGGRAFGSAFPSLGVFSWNFVRPLPLLKCWIATACVPVNVFFGFFFFSPSIFIFIFILQRR